MRSVLSKQYVVVQWVGQPFEDPEPHLVGVLVDRDDTPQPITGRDGRDGDAGGVPVPIPVPLAVAVAEPVAEPGTESGTEPVDEFVVGADVQPVPTPPQYFEFD